MLKRRNTIGNFFLLIFIFLFSSCFKNVIFDKNEKIPDYKWDLNNIIKLDCEVADTLTPMNIYINLRNGSNYQYSNLYLFLTTRTPKGEMARDTLELTLADERGKWMGEGLGDVLDNRILFKKKFQFPESGMWHFELQQAMRINPLPQIMDVGMRIEKVQ